MPPSDTERSRWFALEVQPHEADLRAFLRARFPVLQDTDDIVQETYARLLREHDRGQIREIRAFLFTAARNVALDLLRRRQTAREKQVTHFDSPDVVEERPDAAECLSRQQELEVLAEAVRALPERCRQVVMLRYLKGCSYKETAALLGVSTETVKTHLANGLARCTEYLEKRGMLRVSESLRARLD